VEQIFALLPKKAGKPKWKPRRTYQTMYYIPTTRSSSPRRRLQKPLLGTIGIILPLKQPPVPGSRKLAVSGDCPLWISSIRVPVYQKRVEAHTAMYVFATAMSSPLAMRGSWRKK
jgi:hypothetical protein